jgi:hypothetical protein
VSRTVPWHHFFSSAGLATSQQCIFGAISLPLRSSLFPYIKWGQMVFSWLILSTRVTIRNMWEELHILSCQQHQVRLKMSFSVAQSLWNPTGPRQWPVTFHLPGHLCPFSYSGRVFDPLNIWKSSSCFSVSHFINSPVSISHFLYLFCPHPQLPPLPLLEPSHQLVNNLFVFVSFSLLKKRQKKKKSRDTGNNMSTARIKQC